MQEFDREVEAADVADFLEKGLLENLVLLFRTERNLYALLSTLLRDERISVRIGTSALIESLAEEDPAGRRLAAAELHRLLGDEAETVRGDGAYLLGIAGCRDDIAALRPLLEDTNADVREAAAEAMEAIEGRSCGEEAN